MSYRDGDALAQRDALERRRDALDPESPTRRELTIELEEIDRARRAEARRHLPQIARARIATPCAQSWDAMLGQGAVRTCLVCEKDVLDVARLTLADAQAYLAARGGRACLRLHQRADGTLLFADCEIGVGALGARRLGVAGVAIALAGVALASMTTPDARYAEPDPFYSSGPWIDLAQAPGVATMGEPSFAGDEVEDGPDAPAR